MRLLKNISACWLFFCVSAYTNAQISVDLEVNYIFGIPYNIVRIPSSGGTEIDIANDLETKETFTYRARVNYTFNEKHIISLLAAPLTIKSSGVFDNDVVYSDGVFLSDRNVNATYTFNSYRITYRYLFVNTERLKAGAGVTGKIRHANIALRNEVESADYPDLGFVPLINFYLSWMPLERWQFILEGDALGTRNGRAEDIFAGIAYSASDAVAIKAGYRVLEGGADVPDNYNFTFINYAALGLIIRFY